MPGAMRFGVGGAGDGRAGAADRDPPGFGQHFLDEPIGASQFGGVAGARGGLDPDAGQPVDDVSPPGRGQRPADVLDGQGGAQVGEGQPLPQRPAAQVPSTKAAPNTSPAPVGSCALTGSDGTHSCSPVVPSMAIAPWPPQVTTATGISSARACKASCGSSVWV